MTFVPVDIEIVKAFGLSMTFLGVMLSIITIGIGFLIYKLSKKKKTQYLKMAGLIIGWAVFISLNAQSSSLIGYNPIWLVYSTAHLISIIIGITLVLAFFLMRTEMNKVLDKNILTTFVIFIILSILMRTTFPFFANPYLSLIQRIVIIIPSLLGFLAIIKSHTGGKN